MKKLFLLLIPLLLISCDFNKDQPTDEPETKQSTTQQPVVTQPNTPPETQQPTVTQPDTPPEEPTTPPEGSDAIYTISFNQLTPTNGNYMNLNIECPSNIVLSFKQGAVSESRIIQFRNGSEILIKGIPPSTNPRKITMTVSVPENDKIVSIRPVAILEDCEVDCQTISVSASENPYVIEFIFPANTQYYRFEIKNDDNKSRLKVYERITIQDYVQ